MAFVLAGVTRTATASYDVAFFCIAAFASLPVVLWLFFESRLAAAHERIHLNRTNATNSNQESAEKDTTDVKKSETVT